SFGAPSSGFEGFMSPTGIAVRNGRVYAADNVSKRISIFDRNGSYLGVLASGGLAGPESLRFLEDGRLLAADVNRILLIDPDTAIITELGVLGNSSRVRVTGAEIDRNGNVLAADFKTGEVAIMTRIEDIASGLFVQIDRIVSDKFPLVQVEIQVQDRLRRPVVGLDGRNFLLSEQGQTVSEQSFAGASYLSAACEVAVLFERSQRTLALGDDLAAALRDISAAADRVVSVISAGEQPGRENIDSGATPARRLDEAARGGAASYSPRWRFDLGLRLAAADLLSGGKKRAVIFVGAGSPDSGANSLGELAFEQYGLSELAAYLGNNSIAFYAVIVGQGAPGADIRYLCEETGGQVLSLYRNEGIGPPIKELVRRPSGYYTVTYRSVLPTDFGRAYLPLEAEVYLMDRSGRDSTGYFPPLE
ncbi:MAG: 6-bladed beta-propeller, partial [Treponema sp.]|nr:6-bladed beta-propeller [Treponema sp.]